MSADAALVHIGLYQRRCGLCNDALAPWLALCPRPQCVQRLIGLSTADFTELRDYARDLWEDQAAMSIIDDTCPWCLSMVPAEDIEDRLVYRCQKPLCQMIWGKLPLVAVQRFFEAWERSKR